MYYPILSLIVSKNGALHHKPCQPVYDPYKSSSYRYVCGRPGNPDCDGPRSRETRESELTGRLNRGGEEAENIFNTDAENPFAEFEPNHKHTSVFIKRFFFKWEFSDIAQAHDISVSAAYKIYHYSVQRLLSVIMEMDQVRKAMSPEDQKKSAVKKQKKYLDCNREKVNERRRKHYAKNKERINAKRKARLEEK